MSPSRLLLLAPALLSTACAPGIRTARRDAAMPPPARESRAGARDPGAGPALVPARAAQGRRAPDDPVRRALDAASAQVGRREVAVDGVSYGDDCAALVRAALAAAGRTPPAGDARALHRLAAGTGALRRTPAPGDLVFLADRPGGAPAHVGLVERAAADGTVIVLHHTDRGVSRLRANPSRPWTARTATGRWLNDVLVVDGARVPAGRLVLGFGSLP
jgi:cell wall-associated NlpC family hydrolase